MKDDTLGGYLEAHARPPAFSGSDGRSYSVAIYVEDVPEVSGDYGGALLYVRWSVEGDRPEGHLETDFLRFGSTPGAAEAMLRSLTLQDVKEHLERLIERGQGPPEQSD